MMELEVEAEVVGMPVMEEVGRLSESLGLGLADVPILSAENRSLCGDLASLRVEARRLAAEVEQGWFHESTLISNYGSVLMVFVTIWNQIIQSTIYTGRGRGATSARPS